MKEKYLPVFYSFGTEEEQQAQIIFFHRLYNLIYCYYYK